MTATVALMYNMASVNVRVVFVKLATLGETMYNNFRSIRIC